MVDGWIQDFENGKSDVKAGQAGFGGAEKRFGWRGK